ncbi:MAG: helix-turn-helix domain-containing protein [Bryobacteraceae bacterium]
MLCSDNEYAYPIAIVWRKLMNGVFSSLGRMEYLSRCRDPQTGRYWHLEIADELGGQNAHSAMLTMHELIWRDWMRGSWEQQCVDLRRYLHDCSKKSAQMPTAAQFLVFAPDCCDESERRALLQILEFLLSRLRTEFFKYPPDVQSETFQRALSALRAQYSDPDLSLAALSEATAISERHLARLFKMHLQTNFRQYLREMRIREAALLLAQSQYEIKAIRRNGRLLLFEPFWNRFSSAVEMYTLGVSE